MCVSSIEVPFLSAILPAVYGGAVVKDIPDVGSFLPVILPEPELHLGDLTMTDSVQLVDGERVVRITLRQLHHSDLIVTLTHPHGDIGPHVRKKRVDVVNDDRIHTFLHGSKDISSIPHMVT